MRLLLDSHLLLWWVIAPARIDPAALLMINDRENEVYFSAASVCELCLKQAKGKLRLPEGFFDVLAGAAFRELPVTVQHARAAPELPRIHRDPFDRMLLVQANLGGLLLLTSDGPMRDYPVPTMPA